MSGAHAKTFSPPFRSSSLLLLLCPQDTCKLLQRPWRVLAVSLAREPSNRLDLRSLLYPKKLSKCRTAGSPGEKSFVCEWVSAKCRFQIDPTMRPQELATLALLFFMFLQPGTCIKWLWVEYWNFVGINEMGRSWRVIYVDVTKRPPVDLLYEVSFG